MLNWSMSILFLASSFLLYNILGLCVSKRLNISTDNMAKTMVIGYLLSLFIQWSIGFPCQFLHTSWVIYFFVLFFVYMIIFLYLYIKRNTYRAELIHIIQEHLNRYWFIYVCAAIFSIFSMASSFAYFEMNYDDPFYIGTIVQEVNAPQLAVTNYFNGSYETVSLERIFNTFGIYYGFIAQLFNINITFFAKGAMAFHNYSIIFICFIAFLKPLAKPKDKSYQYVLLIFLILLIPAGYLAQSGIIRMYDDWQFNTAIWYGSSIVRVVGLPILLMLGHDILKDFKIQKVILYVLACIALLSLSSVAITFAIITTMWILLVLLYKYLKNRNIELINIIIILTLITLIATWGLPILFKAIIPGFEQTLENSSLPGYQGYRFKYLTENILLIICMSIVVLYIFIHKEHNFIFYAIECWFLWILTMSGMFDEFIMAISFNYNFVGLRLTTGIQLLSLALAGYCIYSVLKKSIKRSYSVDLFAIMLLIGFVLFNFGNRIKYGLVTIESSGLSNVAFSFSRVIRKTNLMPNIYSDLSNYFDSLDDQKHRVISMDETHYEGSTLLINKGLVMTSRKIEVCTLEKEGCVDIPLEVKAEFASYASGALSFEEVKENLMKYQIEYIITPVEDLKLFGTSKIVLESKSDLNELLYLIKI